MAAALGQVVLTWADFQADCQALARNLKKGPVVEGACGLYGVPTGGCFVAQELAPLLRLPVLDSPRFGCLVVDDLVDSGGTLARYGGYDRAAVYHKDRDVADSVGALTARELSGWVVFPWEQGHPSLRGEGPQDAVVRLLEWVGEDPRRQGLKDTPGRVARALKEMTAGYAEDPAAILGTVFEEPYDEIVLVRGVAFTSLCEHHLLPFTGTFDLGYLPGDKGVVGLSKLARLVDCFARRLQVQERLTQQVAKAVEEHLGARGVGAVCRASHSCMACRGVKKPGAEMVTSCMLGVFRQEAKARAEFLALCRGG